MNVRRSAAALAAVGVLAAAAPATAAGASPSPSPKVTLPAGLFGTSDPTYDGVWRQSLALLAQRTLGERPAASAVDWLVGQQCPDGGFAAFRAAPAGPCGGKGGSADTNSTAAAVQALQALGEHDGEVRKAATWLKTAQNKDGGWGYTPGSPSDTNSTAVVIGALTAAGKDTTRLRTEGRTPYEALAQWSIPCDQDGGGAFAYQPDKKGKLAANADASAAGVLGALGKGFVTTAGKAPAKTGCVTAEKPTPAQLADNAAAYLSGAVAKSGYLKSALPGAADQPDYGNTADTVVALAAAGRTGQAEKSYTWLEKNATGWARQNGPAAYAQLILAAHATGADPRHFGGTDLVRALDATGPAPQRAGATATAGHGNEKRSEHDSGTSVWWIVGVGLVAGIGVGFLLSGRRKKQQP
ncbi:prenyltransferase/squalene oxidase repeat-containing protein [Streptomyces sp. NK08204]|uniref:prenyltransferase/squalene oxidase repeat-containing protein n=1 Tax=Streptomyces sp. NK08204 TaxID=2873260 RepID=UPI001CEDB2F1|nr:prenyltransferase/squalene oxidase repeat-containing protein [Streptomyces sp. NK08204]